MARFTTPEALLSALNFARTDPLTPDQRALYELIVRGPRSRRRTPLVDGDGGLNNPFGPMLLSPAVGATLQAVGLSLYQGVLGEVERELLVLLALAHYNCTYEWDAHCARAADIGIPRSHVGAILAGGPFADLETPARAVVVLGQALLRRDSSVQAAAEAVAARLGPAAVFDAIVIVGYYGIIGHIFDLFPHSGSQTWQPVENNSDQC
jgi:4-carboxymuconolactone decarboxylase